jgi:hypothetical protein
LPIFAARRGGAPIQFRIVAIHRDTYGDKSVSKNDAIFCNPLYWIAKNGIVFAYRHVWRPAAASGNCGRGELQFF